MKNFVQQEELCKAAFLQDGPYWHLCTPGNLQGVIFRNNNEFTYAMNLMARCAWEFPDIKILAFEIMGNHIHQVSIGNRERVEELFLTFRRRLSRNRKKDEDPVDLTRFSCKIIPIETLTALRNTIAYVHRNGYVINPDHTPFSYPWGTGMFFFNQQWHSGLAKDLTYRTLRQMFRCTSIHLPGNFQIIDGYVSPLSYCHIDFAVSLFRDAHNYFWLITKNIEAYASMGELFGDSIFMTDEELYSQISSKCLEKYGSGTINNLMRQQKREMAGYMHYELRASNSQIRRILNLTQYEVDSMFPQSTRRHKQPE